MKSWIKILSLFFCTTAAVADCRFKEDILQVHSLSGPITIALKESGLLQDPRLKAVSVFHPISSKEFSGSFLPGGVFLSPEKSKEMKGGLVFFDESRELSKTFSRLELSAIEVKTRGLLPLEVVRLTIKLLESKTSGCETVFRRYEERAQKVSQEILRVVPKDFRAVFFLGPIRGGRPPEMVIVNDGVVGWLIKEGRLISYPSTLSYVAWSAKLMDELKPSPLRIGIIDSGRQFQQELKHLEGKAYNYSYPGALIPGFSQILAWRELLKELHQ